MILSVNKLYFVNKKKKLTFLILSVGNKHVKPIALNFCPAQIYDAHCICTNKQMFLMSVYYLY